MLNFIYSVLIGCDDSDLPRGGWLCWTRTSTSEKVRQAIGITQAIPHLTASKRPLPGGPGASLLQPTSRLKAICKAETALRPPRALAFDGDDGRLRPSHGSRRPHDRARPILLRHPEGSRSYPWKKKARPAKNYNFW